MTEPDTPAPAYSDADAGAGPTDPALAAVATVATRLAELDALPVVGHAPVYEAVHGVLQDALAGLDDV